MISTSLIYLVRAAVEKRRRPGVWRQKKKKATEQGVRGGAIEKRLRRRK
jgi:hypothetical protein